MQWIWEKSQRLVLFFTFPRLNGIIFTGRIVFLSILRRKTKEDQTNVLISGGIKETRKLSDKQQGRKQKFETTQHSL